jgi:hypothetical protein
VFNTGNRYSYNGGTSPGPALTTPLPRILTVTGPSPNAAVPPGRWRGRVKGKFRLPPFRTAGTWAVGIEHEILVGTPGGTDVVWRLTSNGQGGFNLYNGVRYNLGTIQYRNPSYYDYIYDVPSNLLVPNIVSIAPGVTSTPTEYDIDISFLIDYPIKSTRYTYPIKEIRINFYAQSPSGRIDLPNYFEFIPTTTIIENILYYP